MSSGSAGSSEEFYPDVRCNSAVEHDERRGAHMVELSREQCLQLLGTHSFARLAVGMGKGAPVIRPVNYVFDRRLQSMVFRSGRGSKLHALLRAAGRV